METSAAAVLITQAMEFRLIRTKGSQDLLQAFLEQFKENTQYQCSVVPLGDGVALIRKR